MIPLHLFKDRTITLATVASIMVGVAMFGATVYLGQYFQLSRGMSPTEAGLMSIAMVGGLVVSTTITGRLITGTGLWKRYLVGGTFLVVIGLALLGTIDARTSLGVIIAYMVVVGIGLGASMQNLVLAVQNTAHPTGPRRRELRRHLLPLARWLDRRLGARCGAGAPGERLRSRTASAGWSRVGS